MVLRIPLRPAFGASVGVVVLLCVLAGATGCKKRPRHRPLPPDAGLTGGTLLYETDFSGGLGDFIVESPNWKVVDGRVYTGDSPNENKGLWLSEVELPADMRVEFTATSVKGNHKVFQGDIKCEFGGSRKKHADGYILILGGWKNTVNTIAKRDEHGEGRLVVDSKTRVEEGREYRFQVVRLGSEIKWFLDGKLLLKVQEDDILQGSVFGFNNWNSRVYFDNLRVFAL